MRKSLVIVALICLAAIPTFATTYFVRTDGHNTNCSGLVDAADPGSGSIPRACAFATLPTAITATACGDTIKLKAGQTFDTASLITLPNKSCGTGTEITITSTVALPSARVSPSDSSSMPRLRTTDTDGLFRTAANAGYWILDSLNMTDNVAGGTQRVISMVDFATTSHDLTVQRCLMYPKEAVTDPTNWDRPLVYGIQAEGFGLILKWSYVYGLGLRNGLSQSEAKAPILIVNGHTITATDNFMEGGYIASIFTGGGGEPPEQTTTISSPTSTSAVFASVTDLEIGLYIRFDFAGTGTFTGSSSSGYSDVGTTWNFWVMARTGGTSLVDFDGAGTHQGFHIRFVPTGGGPTYRGRLKAVAGNNYTIVWEYGDPPPAGTYDWIMWAVAEATNITGSTVTFAGVGPNGLLQAPDAPGEAAWRKNQVVHDIVITKNTINIDSTQAVAEWLVSDASPKGWVEFKSGDNILMDGNHFTGYPSVIGVTQHSNEGGTPWTAVKNLTVTNNFVDPVLDLDHNGSRQFMISSLTDPYNSDEPGHTVVISNNLIKNTIYLLDANGDAVGSTMTITHNTIINDHQSGIFGSRLVNGTTVAHGFTFTDNIAAFNSNGIHCQESPFTLAQCYPSSVFDHNVIVDNLGASVTTNSFGTASILSPIKTAFSQVGFVNTATNDYRLSAGSDFKGDGTGGSDPGVNWTALVAALGFDPSGPSLTICKWSTSPRCQAQ